MGLFTKIWYGLRRLVGLIVPFFAKAGDFSYLGTGFRWVLRILLLIAIVVGLYYLNQYWNLAAKLGRARSKFEQDYWLPALFLLICSLVWLGWWLWVLLWPETEPSPFPKIDDAWAEAMQALKREGIGLNEVPLFLILGRPRASEESLFAAAQIKLEVPQTPHDLGASLHVYANREAIYVTCAVVPLLGQLATLQAGEVSPARGGPSDDGEQHADSALGGDPFSTMRASGSVKEVQDILDKTEGREATDEEKRQIRRLIAEDQGQKAQRRAQARGALLKESENWLARLRHLCRLMVRDRWPYCPLNGILLLLPLSSSDGDKDADDAATACQRDLSAAREVLKVHCPLFVLIGDLETVPGFDKFIERLQANQRKQRVGQRFPLVPDLDAKEIPGAIEGAVDWVCQHFFPAQVYELFRLEEAPGREQVMSVVNDNSRLYHVLFHLRERAKRLGRIVARAATTSQNGPPLFGGCYVAATGRDPAREQAFVAGVFRRPAEEQNYVSWTAKALSEEASYHRRLQIGYFGLGGAALAVVVLTVLFFRWPG